MIIAALLFLLPFYFVLGNSLLVTILSIAGLVVLGSAAAWRLVRRKTRTTRTIFFFFVASMVVPFQSIPREIEESAMFDGCTPVQTFSRIVFPLLRSMTVTVIILQTLLIWNDFLLPLPVLGMIPVIVFFLILQKYVVRGVSDAAVKG